MRWADLSWDRAGTATNFEELVADPIRDLAGRTIDVPAGLLGLFTPWSINRWLRSSYDRRLFHRTRISDLTGPTFVIDSTDLRTGKLWRFSQDPSIDDGAGSTPLAAAVAASSAFPPILGPAQFSAATLVDGGVYDNLGLEAAWTSCRTVLVSDAGGSFKEESGSLFGVPWRWRDWGTQSMRVLKMIDHQVRELRNSRSSSGSKSRATAPSTGPAPTGGSAATSRASGWPTRSDFAPADEALGPGRLAETPTRLAALGRAVQDGLIDWGYVICDTAMRCRRGGRRAAADRVARGQAGGAGRSLESNAEAGSGDPAVLRAMSLRPLLDLAAENERVHALAGRVLAAADGGESVSLRASQTLRPLLLAALLEDDRGLAGRPALLVAADDRAARDLAADLRAYLAPRRVRLYPSRGTGYASSVTPPPHLVGLRIDALDALSREADAIVVASAVALAEAVPDASLRPAGFEIAKGDEVDLGAVAEDLVAAGYERVEQVEERGQFAVRGGILDVYPATEERAVRIELFGDEVESMRWFSTFTQRSLGEAEVVELAPAAELDADHRELAALAAREAAEGEAGDRPGGAAAAGSVPGPARPRPGQRRRRPRRPGRDRARPARRLGGRDHLDEGRGRPPPLRRRRRAAERARRALADQRRGGRRRSRDLPRLARREPRPLDQRGGVGAGETGPLRLPHRGRLRLDGGGGARPLRARPDRRARSSKAAGSAPTPASPSPRRACARASSRRS